MKVISKFEPVTVICDFTPLKGISVVKMLFNLSSNNNKAIYSQNVKK